MYQHTQHNKNNFKALHQFTNREQVEPLLEHALELAKDQHGSECMETASILHNLAGLYKSQGKYEQAEPLYLIFRT